MTGLKPIKKAVRRTWYLVKFSYEHMDSAAQYDAEADVVVRKDVRVGPIELTVQMLAANGAAASKLVREGAADGIRPGTFDVKTGDAIEHKPIEGTVVILGVEEWKPLEVKKKEGVWQ